MCYKAQTERGKKREKFTEKENYLKFCSSPIVLFSNLVSIDARVFSVVLCVDSLMATSLDRPQPDTS